MRLFLFLSILLTLGCNHNLKISDSKQSITQSGTTYSYIVVRIEYIDQLKQICTDENPVRLFNDSVLQKQAIAMCVLSNLNIFHINSNQATNFLSQYCGQGADLSQLTDKQKVDTATACNAFGTGG